MPSGNNVSCWDEMNRSQSSRGHLCSWAAFALCCHQALKVTLHRQGPASHLHVQTQCLALVSWLPWCSASILASRTGSRHVHGGPERADCNILGLRVCGSPGRGRRLLFLPFVLHPPASTYIFFTPSLKVCHFTALGEGTGLENGPATGWWCF